MEKAKEESVTFDNYPNENRITLGPKTQFKNLNPHSIKALEIYTSRVRPYLSPEESLTLIDQVVSEFPNLEYVRIRQTLGLKTLPQSIVNSNIKYLRVYASKDGFDSR